MTSQMTGKFNIIKREKLNFLHKIGQGGYGTVYRATHEDFGDVAVKCYLEDSSLSREQKKHLYKEAEALSKLSHENIVSIRGVVMEHSQYFLVLEFVEYGNILTFLARLRQAMNPPMVWREHAILETLGAMNFLHNSSPAVLHLDLKGANVLVTSSLVVKICDFGLAKWKSTSRTLSRTRTGEAQTLQGTATHIPPEAWQNITMSPNMAFDVYAFGILMWEILTMRDPYPGVNNPDIASRVIEGRRPTDHGTLPDGVNVTFQDAMTESWAQDPEDRPALRETYRGLRGIFDADLKAGLAPAKAKIFNAIGQWNSSVELPMSEARPPPPAPHASGSDGFPSFPSQSGLAGLPNNMVARHTGTDEMSTDMSNLQLGRGAPVSPTALTGPSIDMAQGGSGAAIDVGEVLYRRHVNGAAAASPHPSRTRSQEVMQHRSPAQHSVGEGTKQPPPSPKASLETDGRGLYGGPGQPQPPSYSQSMQGQAGEGGPGYEVRHKQPAQQTSLNVEIGSGQAKMAIHIQHADHVTVGAHQTVNLTGTDVVGGVNFRKPPQILQGSLTASTRRVTRDDAMVVSSGIGSQWKSLARQLGLPEADLQAISHDFHQYGLREFALQTVLRWGQVRGRHATAQALARALADMERADIALQIKDSYL